MHTYMYITIPCKIKLVTHPTSHNLLSKTFLVVEGVVVGSLSVCVDAGPPKFALYLYFSAFLSKVPGVVMTPNPSISLDEGRQAGL